MDLAQKFETASVTDVLIIDSLDVGLQYPIVLAAKVKTRFGPSIVLTLRDDEESKVLKVFLPSRYYSLFSDVDIDVINSQTVHYSFVYRGRHEKTRAFIITIVKEAEEP
jgi:hypothetical protein